MALIDTPEAANRLAQAIVSDISLYNEDRVIEGVKNDDLFEALKDEIDEGRHLYEGRVSPDLLARTNFFHRAVVDVLLKSKGHIWSNIW